MIYAHINTQNEILGWYDSEIHPVIPQPNIEVSKEDWEQAIQINANCIENNKFIYKDFSTEIEKVKMRISELKSLLDATDYKVLPDYDKPSDEIKIQRQIWREEIRQLETNT